MDTGEGHFTMLSEEKGIELERKGVTGLFKEGEEIELRGSRFKVHAIRKKRLILKLLPNRGIDA